MWQAVKQFLAPPTFPDPEQTRAARWLNIALLVIIPVIVVALVSLFFSSSSPELTNFFLTSDIVTLIIALFTWVLMRRGFFKIAAMLPITTLFLICTYINFFVFQSIRSPTVIAYFALIPLVGLLLGRRNMNIFAAICVVAIGLNFYLEETHTPVSTANTLPVVNDLNVLFLSIVFTTTLLNASIRRAEEKTEEIRKTAASLAVVNQKLQASQVKLQQAHDELEERVRQRTQDLRLVNLSLHREIEERQLVLDALSNSEAKLRSLVDNVPDIIVNINLDGIITLINRTIGAQEAESLIGCPATRFHTRSQYQALLTESMERVLKTGETVAYESEEATESGVQWKINRVGGIKQEKKIVAFILIATDITEQKQTQAAMYQAQKLESLGIMAGGVAHDFNNLLTAMLMQLSSATTKLPADHPVVLHLERTIKAAERATELTRQMLNYTGRNQSEIKPLDLNDLITDNIHLFSAGIPKNIVLEPRLQGSIPLIMGDRGQIQQLIMNLILNGADAIGQKSGAIKVVTEVQEVTATDVQYWKWSGSSLASGRYVRLEVHDNGSGMDAKTLAKIFDPFFTTKFTGRGLGLASVLGIVRSHKAGLHVASTVGQGTIFTILFPAIGELIYPIEETVEVAPIKLTNELVLIIDDEDMVRETMCDILTETGLQVLQASDGPTGIQLFRQHVCELKLVLLDLSMPGMSGEAVFYELREIDPNVPILLISGYSEHEIMERFVNKGLAGFIQKPYTIKHLLQQIQPHLRQSSAKNDKLAIRRGY